MRRAGVVRAHCCARWLARSVADVRCRSSKVEGSFFALPSLPVLSKTVSVSSLTVYITAVQMAPSGERVFISPSLQIGYICQCCHPANVWGGAPRSCENVCYPGMVTYHKIYSPHLKIARHPDLPEILRHPEDGEHHLEIAADLEMGGHPEMAAYLKMGCLS